MGSPALLLPIPAIVFIAVGIYLLFLGLALLTRRCLLVRDSARDKGWDRQGERNPLNCPLFCKLFSFRLGGIRVALSSGRLPLSLNQPGSMLTPALS